MTNTKEYGKINAEMGTLRQRLETVGKNNQELQDELLELRDRVQASPAHGSPRSPTSASTLLVRNKVDIEQLRTEILELEQQAQNDPSSSTERLEAALVELRKRILDNKYELLPLCSDGSESGAEPTKQVNALIDLKEA